MFSDPCFNLPGDLTGLTRDDAEFVMVIHTNAGGLGKRELIGIVLPQLSLHTLYNILL